MDESLLFRKEDARSMPEFHRLVAVLAISSKAFIRAGRVAT
jgi:hypothetical protein